MIYEITNNMYQNVKIIIDKHNSVSIEPRSSIQVDIDSINEHIEDLKRSGNIKYKKIINNK